MAEPDYYAVLGIARDADADAVRSAYRSLARQYHPDVNQDDEARQRFQQITAAYEVLSDPKKRQAYDRFGRAGVGASRARSDGMSGGVRYPWPGGAAGPDDHPDFAEFVEQIFRGHPGGPMPRASRPAQRRGQDLKQTLTVSFLTAAQGGVERVGSTSGRDAQRLEVRIPPGVEPGTRLRLKGRGRPGVNGGPPGDLIVTVEVGEHPWFRRDGLDIELDVPVTIAEAALGTTVTVPLLEGNAELKIPAGAASGRKLRLRGRGIRDASGRSGDFLAVIQIVAPKKLSRRGTELLQELSDELQNPRDGGPWADKP